MFFSNAGADINLLLLALLGLSVGVCSSFFGVGGGFIMTPGLNLLGFPIPFAIGTDLGMMAGSATMSTLKHRRLGQVNFRVGALMVAGAMPGIEAGKRVVLFLERTGNAEVVVRSIFVALLVTIGILMFRESRRVAADARDDSLGREVSAAGLARRLRDLRLPPMLAVQGGSVSMWLPFAIGVATGPLVGMLGVGGGFMMMPALVYLLCMPTRVAVGTSLFGIVISAGYGVFSYALAGKVEMVAAAMMLLASSAGVQIGAAATRYVSGAAIRQLFALVLLAIGVSLALAQVASIYRLSALGSLATYILLAMAGGMSLLITTLFLLRRGKAGERGRRGGL